MEKMGICFEHYIQTFKGGVPTKVWSIDSRGRPAPKIKSLREVYESEDARRMRMCPNVKLEVPCFPSVDRTLHEPIECGSNDGDYIDLDDDTTLKQLRDRSLLKKRKRVYGHKNTHPAPVCDKPLDDQSDLDELIINLKLKMPKKSRAKAKLLRRSVASLTTSFVPQREENLIPEDTLQFSGAIVPVKVKVEAYEAEEGGCRTTYLADDSSIDHDEGSNEFQMMDQRHCTEEYPDCVTNRISYDHLDIEPVLMLVPWNGVDVKLETPELEDQDYLDLHPLAIEYGEDSSVVRSPIEFGEDSLVVHSCKSSHLHDDLDIEPTPWDGVEVEDQDNLDSHPLAIGFGEENLEDNSYESSHLDDVLAIESGEENSEDRSCQSSHLNDVLAVEFGKDSLEEHPSISSQDFSSHSSMHGMSEQSNCSEVQVPDMAISLPQKQDESLSSHDQAHESSFDSSISMKIDNKSIAMEDITVDEEQPSICTLDGTTSNDLNDQSSHMKVELLRSGAKVSAVSPVIDAEADSRMKNQCFDTARTVSSPELCSHPEKLLSKRKVISPSSREQLRLAMKLEQYNDIDQYKCKEKLFVNQTGKKTSPLKSDTLPGKAITNSGGRGLFIQRNGIRHAIKKPQHEKGNYDGLRSRAYPNLSSSRNSSVQGCSESAIEFSQRQMHDMENVAVKLMKELNSMKGIVEEKLLFQSYRSGSLKNDADEVRSAINNATRVEEVARKWLVNMSRDCNRFCKIMKMTPPTSVDSKDAVRNGQKKISFADDSGGKLCHVKLFEKGEGSLASNEVKQGGRST